MVDSLIEVLSTLLLRRNNLFLDAFDPYVTVLLLLDLHFLSWFASDSISLHACWVEQVVYFLVIQLKETNSDFELGEFTLGPSDLQFVKDELEDSRHDSDLFLRHSDAVSSSHGVGLS